MSDRPTEFLTATKPGPWDLFVTFLKLGIQSFGGGSATFYMIHQACIDRGWLDEDEFIRAWSLAQVSPGINLIKLTILIGYHLRGWLGLAAAVTGLLLPSAGVTVLMTAVFTLIRGQPLVEAALKGVLPATIGLSLAMGVQMARPLLSRAEKESRVRLALSVLILVGSAVILAASGISPVVVLLAGGAVPLLFAVFPVKPPQVEEKETA